VSNSSRLLFAKQQVALIDPWSFLGQSRLPFRTVAPFTGRLLLTRFPIHRMSSSSTPVALTEAASLTAFPSSPLRFPDFPDLPDFPSFPRLRVRTPLLATTRHRAPALLYTLLPPLFLSFRSCSAFIPLPYHPSRLLGIFIFFPVLSLCATDSSPFPSAIFPLRFS
jgi:hypothetical protein